MAEYERRRDRESHAEFAARKGLNLGTFRRWLYRLRNEASAEALTFVEIEATSLAQSSPIEIAIGEAMRVKLSSSTPASRVAEIVAELVSRLG